MLQERILKITFDCHSEARSAEESLRSARVGGEAGVEGMTGEKVVVAVRGHKAERELAGMFR